MTDVVVSEIPGVGENEKKNRPDGTDLDRYKNLEKWSYRRWAWEFLRRNVEFTAECKRVDEGTEADKLAVAKQYGLKVFKRFSEGFKGKSGPPKFNIGSISYWQNLGEDKENSRLVPIRIGHGQLVIRFDLASALIDQKALDKQFRLAEQRARKNLALYEKLVSKDAAVHKYKALNFGIYIRLLDYLALKKSPLECAKLVFPTKVANGTTDHYLSQDVKCPIEAAIKLADEGYLYLSVLKGKPNGKGVLLKI